MFFAMTFASESIFYLQAEEERCVWKQNPGQGLVIFEHALPCPTYGKIYEDGQFLFIQEKTLRVVSNKQMFLSFPKNSRLYESIYRPYMDEEGSIFWPFYDSSKERVVLYRWSNAKKTWYQDVTLSNIPSWIAESHTEDLFNSFPSEKSVAGIFDTVQTIPANKVLANINDFFVGTTQIPTKLIKWSENHKYFSRILLKKDKFVYLGLRCTDGCVIKEAVFCRKDCTKISKYKVGSITIANKILLQGSKTYVWGDKDTIPKANRVGFLSTAERCTNKQNQGLPFQYVYDPSLSSEPIRVVSTSLSPSLPQEIQKNLEQLDYKIIIVRPDSAEDYLEQFVEKSGDWGLNFMMPDSAFVRIPDTIYKSSEPYNRINTRLFFKSSLIARLAKASEYEDIKCTYFEPSHKVIAEMMGCEGSYEANSLKAIKQLRELSFASGSKEFLITTPEQRSINKIFTLMGRGEISIVDGPIFEEYHILNTSSSHPFIKQFSIDLEYLADKPETE